MFSLLGLIDAKSWPRIARLNHNDDHMYGTGGRSAQPCRACNDFKQWAQTNVHNKTTEPTGDQHVGKECPLSRDQLGRNTWSLLHTMAAYYPKEPSPQQRTDMKQWIEIFGRFYPCDDCAKDFRSDIATDPPQTQSQQALSQWFCRIHNKVNQKLGKKLFDCKRVDERWLNGWSDGSCD
ncbi:unnamed protein product [Medioppia subpectinata]|uniref:Sulfhydryl oxidase n=1 Tax=Medioppia subpectinata TaxID=1979941 RepID=A0A7R9PZE2_9ACAR|nr:unnamed protein product [Medioppia subpectinata]CAG2106845.1 unnamed protein product [Medioppia subpectinata]